MRFPEFQGEWEVFRFGDIATNKSDKFNPEHNSDFVRCIELEHLSSIDGQLLGFVDGSKLGSIKNIFNKGDVLFGKLRPYLRKYHQTNFDGVCSSEIWVLKAITTSNDFLYNIVQTKQFVELANQSSGSKMPRADWNIVESGFFSVPNLPEQRKISSFLALLDKRIQTQRKIISQLKALMKSLSDKLFSQQLRLKDQSGNEYPDWEVRKGSDIFMNTTNRDHASDLPILAITQDHGAIPRNLIEYQISVTDKSVESYKVVEVGDFIISLRSFEGGIEYSSYRGICSPAYVILRSKIEIDALFYKHFFKTNGYIQLLSKKLEGIRDGKMISYNYFSDIQLPYPELEEQNNVSTCLTCIVRKIDIEKAVLNRYKSQKEWFLQKLFI